MIGKFFAGATVPSIDSLRKFKVPSEQRPTLDISQTGVGVLVHIVRKTVAFVSLKAWLLI